jgi:hypothetical protein
VTPKVFLLSPASVHGRRAAMLTREEAAFDLAVRFRECGAPVGEVFQFISGLYFRGKLAYAEAFASPPPGVPGSLVITAGRGLVEPGVVLRHSDLVEIAGINIDAGEARYRVPLERNARELAARVPPETCVILLGSVASPKYVEPLIEVFGERLLFPLDFVGRGDMSRGGLMLRAASSGVELAYGPALGAIVRGKRPPKLEPLRRSKPES